jgi:hypothetical protein
VRVTNRDVRRLVQAIEAAGGRVTLSKRGHFKVYINDRLVTTLPQTPSDRRSLLNARAAIRRAGIQA